MENEKYQKIKDIPTSLNEVIKAKSIVSTYLKPSQMTRYEGLSRLIGAEIYVKHENHNPSGTFKIRGSINLMSHLKNLNIKNVISFSTGNHGISVAASAGIFGIKAVIVVPENNNPVKNRKIIEAGAELVEAGRTFEECAKTVDKLCLERDMYYVHPADEPCLINGVGTEFLEIIEDLPDIDVMIVPIGAGSEAAAAVTVLNSIRTDIEIIAVQAQASAAAHNSWKAKSFCTADNKTFAGGFATGQPYKIPFNIYRDSLEDFILLTEEEIYKSIGMAFFYTNNLVEGAGGSCLMAAYKISERLKSKNVVIQMSGCNASAEEIEKAISYSVFKNGMQHDESCVI